MEIIVVGRAKASILRRRAKPVGKVTQEVQQLVDAMIGALHEVKGLGLAAPQVGISKRLFVAEVEDRLHVIIDPTIVKREGEEVATEACLSIPGIVADVPRAAHIIVKGKNRRGRGITIDAEGLLARVIQHEVDHLDGILYLDRVVDRTTIREVTEEGEVVPAATG
jgi:peptide deformylase